MHPKHYQIRIKATKLTKDKKEVLKAQVCDILNIENNHSKFEDTTQKRAIPKIYVVNFKSKIIYVGITKQKISDRLRQGLTAEGRGGFHGYAWKNLAPRGGLKPSEWIDLFVYCIGNKNRAEAIEAEIVYLFRNKTDKWPMYQTEIHFHQANNKEKEIAKNIYDRISVN